MQRYSKNKSAGTYDFFVSYNSADVEFVERLVNTIEKEAYNGRTLRCFFAPWNIEPGENILLKIEDALSNSRFIGLIMSPDWLKSNWTTMERVIPVHEDPAGIKGRIIPILRRNCIIPPTIRILNWLDFRTDRNFDREIRRLVARLTGKSVRQAIRIEDEIQHPLQSIDSLKPDFQKEIIVSNLFQVLRMPETVNRATAKVRKRSSVWEMLGEGVKLPIFALREESQEIYSFAALTNPQQKLIKLVKDPIANKLSTSELISSDKSSIIVELLNRSMTEHLKVIGMVYDWRNKKTFFPLEKEGDEFRYSTWSIGNREYKRFIVQKTKSGRYYVHRSVKATFTLMGKNLFLKVLPGWHFTVDGLLIPVSKRLMQSLSAKWMNIQRNHSILDDVRFWIYKISEGTENAKINVGFDIPVLISSTPFSAAIDKGITEDYRERLWLEEPSPDEVAEISDEEEILEEDSDEESKDY